MAAEILNGDGSYEITVDESSFRPRVVVKARVPEDRIDEVVDRLNAAYRDYEFLTSVEVSTAA